MILIVNNYTENVHLGQLQMEHLGRYVKSLCGLDFIVKGYNEVSRSTLLEFPELKGIVLGGCNSDWNNLYFDIFDGEFELIREAKIPVLGICAGHQLMAMAYEGSARNADYGRRERVFTEIEIVKESPLTKGLSSLYCFEYHMVMVPEAPEGFEVLAKSKKTAIQAMRKRGEHKYGTQFHPELDYEASNPVFKADPAKVLTGERVLKNFLALCS